MSKATAARGALCEAIAQNAQAGPSRSRPGQHRHYSPSSLRRSTLASARGSERTASPGVVGIASTSRRPIGGMRGAITGFALGLGAASAYGLVYVVHEYTTTTRSLGLATRELEESTGKVTQAYARVSELEGRLANLESSASTTDEVRRRYNDLVNVYDALHEDVFEAKRKLYDIEQDLNRAFGTPLSRKANGRLV